MVDVNIWKSTLERVFETPPNIGAVVNRTRYTVSPIYKEPVTSTQNASLFVGSSVL